MLAFEGEFCMWGGVCIGGGAFISLHLCMHFSVACFHGECLCLGGAYDLCVLLALSHVFRESFVCSFALVHVFRGSLWAFVLFCSFAGGVEPLCLFLRSRRLIWVFDRHMIGVEPFVPLLEGSCVFDLYMIGVEPFVPLLEGSFVLVSVVSSRCPCLWEPRLFKLLWPLCFFSCQVILIFVVVWLSFTWMSLSAFAFQTSSLCSYVVNSPIKGEKFEQIKLTCTLIL